MLWGFCVSFLDPGCELRLWKPSMEAGYSFPSSSSYSSSSSSSSASPPSSFNSSNIINIIIVLLSLLFFYIYFFLTFFLYPFFFINHLTIKRIHKLETKRGPCLISLFLGGGPISRGDPIPQRRPDPQMLSDSLELARVTGGGPCPWRRPNSPEEASI